MAGLGGRVFSIVLAKVFYNNLSRVQIEKRKAAQAKVEGARVVVNGGMFERNRDISGGVLRGH